MLKSFGTAFGTQCKHDALLGVTVLKLFVNTTREVIEATLLVNVSTKMVYHMVYPHIIKTDNYATITMCFQMM